MNDEELRELDAAVAREVLGWAVESYPLTSGVHWIKRTDGEAWTSLPAFSQDIGQAWQVVEHLRQHPDVVQVALKGDASHGWYVLVEGQSESVWSDAMAEELTVAVCVAALAWARRRREEEQR